MIYNAKEQVFYKSWLVAVKFRYDQIHLYFQKFKNTIYFRSPTVLCFFLAGRSNDSIAPEFWLWISIWAIYGYVWAPRHIQNANRKYFFLI